MSLRERARAALGWLCARGREDAAAGTTAPGRAPRTPSEEYRFTLDPDGRLWAIDRAGQRISMEPEDQPNEVAIDCDLEAAISAVSLIRQRRAIRQAHLRREH